MSDHTHSFMTHGYTNASHTHGYTPFERIVRARPNLLYGKPLFIDPNCPPGKLYWLSDGCYAHPGVIDDLVAGNYAPYADQIPPPATTDQQPAKAPMSTIDKITNERREKREREEAEAKFDHWEQLIGGPEEGAVITYTKTVDEKVVRYVAIFTNGKWQTSRNGEYDVEGFIRLLIVADIEPTDLAYMEPIE